MKVRIEFTVDMDDHDRRILTYFYDGVSDPEPASRETIKMFFSDHGISTGWTILGDENENLRVFQRDERERAEMEAAYQNERAILTATGAEEA